MTVMRWLAWIACWVLILGLPILLFVAATLPH